MAVPTIYVKLLLFEVVIWLVKANCLFLIVLLSLKERKNMEDYLGYYIVLCLFYHKR